MNSVSINNIKIVPIATTETLCVNYSFAKSMFGSILIASTATGICYIAFVDNKTEALTHLKNFFSKAIFTEKMDELQKNVLLFLTSPQTSKTEIIVHVKATDFQLIIWNALLKIPFGKLYTYGQIAKEIGNTKAARAVGTAIGSNPIAYIIPCHRVVQASGNTGGYMWGSARKKEIINWESSTNKQTVCSF